MLTRRTFLAGVASAPLALSSLNFSGKLVPETRMVFDSVTGAPVVGAKIIVKRVGGRGRFVFRTDSAGNYPFGRIAASVNEPTLFRLRIPPASLKKQYAAIDLAIVVAPLARKNAGYGNFGLLPLSSSSFGLSNDYFESNWLDLIKSTLFAQEYQSNGIAKGVLSGAITRFPSTTLKLRFSNDFSSSEYLFVKEEMLRALNFYSHGSYKFKISRIAPANIPQEAAQVPAGQIIINRSKVFPRPAVLLNPVGNNGDVAQNPNTINSAMVHLDNYTLDSLFKDNQGSDGELEFARSLLQRCGAGVFGWRPTTKLPGLSIMDETSYSPQERVLPGYSDYDLALAKAANGGGSGCYPAGTRFARNKKNVILKADLKYPLNSKLLLP